MTTPSKDLYKKNGFLKSQPSVAEGIVIDVGGSNIAKMIKKLDDISSSLDGGINLNGGNVNVVGSGGSSITYAKNVDVRTGSFSVIPNDPDPNLSAKLEADDKRTTVVFVNNTDVEIAVKLSSSISPSYIIGTAQTYEAIQSNAQLAHTFEYYDPSKPATKGKWFRTFTK